ncbi:peptide subunit release factor 1 (eRF1) [Haloactinospora alba]|uniref:Peptide subunit release factor 1 (ERF1) n=1 Tax=Haloactinospora alba TaxID=405555 RepID=A0A543NL42_9ACTN|nr:Vms1/Ankzf1 family peptidyl-tRNA hydrolase [Haloactinospora alba]TQN32541.1 peptide subunit release factor 1 (eRF1) [Haloactinospora alba]
MDLSFLLPAYDSSNLVASVYLNVSRDAEDADHAIRVRWDKARDDLAEQGADEETLRALDGAAGRDDGTPGPRGQVLFAAGGEVLFDILVSRPPQDYSARFGPLPNPVPYLERRGQHVPYVMAVVDSIGADLDSVDAQGARVDYRVEGDEHPTHKPREGGEHHKQMQRAVDEQVKQNAKRVVSEIRRLTVDGETELIVLAGETPVQREVHEQLPDGLRGKVVEAATDSRDAEADEEDTWINTELSRLLADRADQQVQDVADSYEQGRGNDDRAVEGLEPVVYALQRGQVETLLWAPGTSWAETRVWVGDTPEQLAPSEQELRDLGAERPVRERADAALVRAAVGTSADFVFVPEDKARMRDGLGALLRFSDPSLSG